MLVLAIEYIENNNKVSIEQQLTLP